MFVEGQEVEGQVEVEGGRSQAVHVAAGPSLVVQTAGSRIDFGRSTVELVEATWVVLRHDVGKILDHRLLEVEMAAVALNYKNQPFAGLAEDRKSQVGGWNMRGMPFVLDEVVVKKVLGTVQRSSW
jgi:hypothetical protein